MIDSGTNDELANASQHEALGDVAQVPGLKRAGGALPSVVPSRRLDFLRGAAAVYVVIGHARGHLFAGGAVLTDRGGLEWHDYLMLALLQLTSMGTEAVILFFVMSGFAMAHSFTKSESTLSFYKKRLIRIWPPYLLAIALAFVIAGIILRSPVPNVITALVDDTSWDGHQALAMALYTKVGTVLTGQFWSLPHEVIFYALCPLILASRQRVIAFWFLAAVLILVGTQIFGVYYNPTLVGSPYAPNWQVVSNQFFFSLLIFFMAGAVVYHYQHRIPQMSGGVLLLVFIASFIFIWFVKYRFYGGGWNIVTKLMVVPVAVLLIGNVPASLYDRKWLNWGHFSYSLYVFHMQFIVLISYVLARVWRLEQHAMTSYWMWMLAVPPVIGASWLLYLAVEKRCDGALTRIRNRERKARADAVEYLGVR
jgi:peptidoglycan/LPS O-acetylase OafA/YrhL